MRIDTMYDNEGNEVRVVRGSVKDFSSPTFAKDLCDKLDEARGPALDRMLSCQVCEGKGRVHYGRQTVGLERAWRVCECQQ